MIADVTVPALLLQLIHAGLRLVGELLLPGGLAYAFILAGSNIILPQRDNFTTPGKLKEQEGKQFFVP